MKRIFSQGTFAATVATWVLVTCGATWSTVSVAQSNAKKTPGQESEEALPASVDAERVLAKKPRDKAARLQAARAHLAEGAETPSRVEAARQHALAVLEVQPTDPDALLLAGQASLMKGDPTSAARYYRAATLVDANNATAFLGLGDALTRLGDESSATAAFAQYRVLMGMPALKTESIGK